jgi:hypothetical protein
MFDMSILKHSIPFFLRCLIRAHASGTQRFLGARGSRANVRDLQRDDPRADLEGWSESEWDTIGAGGVERSSASSAG